VKPHARGTFESSTVRRGLCVSVRPVRARTAAGSCCATTQRTSSLQISGRSRYDSASPVNRSRRQSSEASAGAPISPGLPRHLHEPSDHQPPGGGGAGSRGAPREADAPGPVRGLLQRIRARAESAANGTSRGTVERRHRVSPSRGRSGGSFSDQGRRARRCSLCTRAGHHALQCSAIC
jgi:hypothetical protein